MSNSSDLTHVSKPAAPSLTTNRPGRTDLPAARLSLLALGEFAVATAAFLIAGVLPDIAHTLHVAQTHASFLITIYALTFAVASPLIAIATSRVPRQPLLVIGLLVMSVGTALSAVLPSFGLVLLARVVSALGAAAFVPTATSTAAAIVAPRHRGQAIAIVVGGLTAAVALGAPIGTALAALGGWRVPLIVAAALSVVVVAGVAISLREIPTPVPILARDRFALLRDARVALVLLTTLVVTAAQYSAYNFLAVMQDRATHGSGTTLALVYFVYGAAATLGNFGAGLIADRRGSRRVLAIALPMTIAAFAVLPLAGAHLWSTLLVDALWGFGAWSATLALQQRLVQINPDAIAWHASATFFGLALARPIGTLGIRLVGAHNLALIAIVPLIHPPRSLVTGG